MSFKSLSLIAITVVPFLDMINEIYAKSHFLKGYSETPTD